MSEQVLFVVYYGSGNVRQTVLGADLSEFAYVEMQLMDPEKASIRWFEYYLTVNFGLDPEVWTVRVQSFWTKSRDFFLGVVSDKSEPTVGGLVRIMQTPGDKPRRPNNCRAEAAKCGTRRRWL